MATLRQSPVAETGSYPVTRKPARGRGTLLRLVGAGVMFTVMADTTATTLAVGLMQHGDAGNALPLNDLLWLTSAAFVPIAALLATAGRWADLFGRRRVLIIGLVVFVLGGLATLTVPDWPMVLAARAVQGVGAAAMIPASLAVLLGELPEHQRRGAIALWSSASGVGCLLMQAGGGWLAEGFGWRALFAPVVVVGMLLLLAATWLPPGLPAGRSGARTRPDMLGAVLLAASIGAIVLAISKATSWGVVCAYLAAGALVLLVLSLLRSRSAPGARRRPDALAAARLRLGLARDLGIRRAVVRPARAAAALPPAPGLPHAGGRAVADAHLRRRGGDRVAGRQGRAQAGPVRAHLRRRHRVRRLLCRGAGAERSHAVGGSRRASAWASGWGRSRPAPPWPPPWPPSRTSTPPRWARPSCPAWSAAPSAWPPCRSSSAIPSWWAPWAVWPARWRCAWPSPCWSARSP
ncbi:MFS transporter [Nonomuraea ferruginea]